jgi:putative beta barrel porin BBP7
MNRFQQVAWATLVFAAACVQTSVADESQVRPAPTSLGFVGERASSASADVEAAVPARLSFLDDATDEVDVSPTEAPLPLARFAEPLDDGSDMFSAAFDTLDVAEDLKNDVFAAAFGEKGASCGDTPGACCLKCRSNACCPRWTIRAGALWLTRSTPDPAVLVTNSFFPGGATLLNANQFHFNFAPGFEVDAIRHNVRDSGWDVQARFFDVWNMNASTPSVFSPAGAVVQYGIPLGNTSFPATISASYNSQLLSTELNLRRQTSRDWLTVLTGFRYVELDEQGLSILQNIGGLNLARNQINALNHLFGGQVGAEVNLLNRRRLSLTTFGKAGLYGVSNSNSVRITQSATPVTFTSAATDGNVAFVGEMGVAGMYTINNRWALRTAYQLLWVDGVALASDQVRSSSPFFGSLGTATVSTGNVFYQGLFVGFQYTR